MLRESSVYFPQSYRLPPGYRLEQDADILTLRRSDGSFVGAFSARGVSEQALLRAAADDRFGRPIYAGPQEHADAVRRMVQTRMECSWEDFLRTERRLLQARKNGQLAKALARRLPGESQEELDRMASQDRRRAEKGLVALKPRKGGLYYKLVDELLPEDRPDRMGAELSRIEWLLERQGRRNIVHQWDSVEGRPSRKSQGSAR